MSRPTSACLAMQRCCPMQTNPEQSVETGKMVHVGMRYKGMSDAQKLAGYKRCQITEIEKQGTTAKSEVDVKAGVGKRLIDETGLSEPGHDACVATPALAQRRTGLAPIGRGFRRTEGCTRYCHTF